MIDLNKIAIICGQRDVTYGEFLQRVASFARVTPKGKDTKTVVLSENREGWIYAFFSIWQQEGVAIPVDVSSTASDIAYILRDSQPDAVWVSKDREPVLKEAIQEAGVTTKVLYIDDYESLPMEDGPSNAVLPWAAMLEPDNDDTAVIIYTSGTTGSPKGVMLSYANLMFNIKNVAHNVPIFTPERRTLILLPLHHVLPLVGTLIAPIYAGGGVAICPSLSGPDIMETLCRGKVAIMVGVPRLWQTLYVGIKKKIDQSAIARLLFSVSKMAKSPTLSKILFSSVRKKMGGHIEYCVCGGAALNSEIGEGLGAIGLAVLEGYGMTETAPMISFTRPGDYIPGCSGLPLPGVECKLVDGELCVRGGNVMKGYYKRPEETAAVIDSDGFLHTGDLASLDSIGRITITGRTKEIIVLSNGKNVQPNEIEYKLEKYDTYVKEAAIVQDDDKLCAIIVPQMAWAATLSDDEAVAQLKREVIEPYNLTVSAYKKVMSVVVYRDDLPRTKLEKLQRFKLVNILKEEKGARTKKHEEKTEPTAEEYRLIKTFIEQEKGVKVHAADHIETDLALDSLDRISLQGFIERTFGVSIGVDEMPAFPNVEAIATHVAAQKTRMEVENVDWNQLLHSSVDALEMPTAGFGYRLCATLAKWYFRIYNSLSVKGKGNIPAKGACILAPNHQSFVDGPLTLAGMSWGQLGEYYFYATEEHVRGDRRRSMAAKSNIVVMERANLKDSILKLAKVLREGHRVIIFPEGARTHDGAMIPFKKTFAILAKELQVPIVPVCIKGAYETLPRGSRFMKPKHIEMTYLPAIVPTEEQTYEELTQLTQDAIEKVLAK